MTIKHLVLSGGGSILLQYLGILQYLNEKEFWSLENIESIFAVSAGAFLSVILCLGYDWETVNQYMIERPWRDVFKLKPKQIIDAYCKKGLYDKKIIETALKPLLEAKDLSLQITLKEFYEYSKIKLHIFTFELNLFKTIEINHETDPDLSLISAIAMSAALPGLFMPICREDKCYIDGGVMTNYPLSFCLEHHENKEEILGLNYCICKTSNLENMDTITNTNNNQNNITEDSTILDFIIGFSVNAMNFITNNVKTQTIPHEIVCELNESPVSFGYINHILYSMEKRKELIEKGCKIGEIFLSRDVFIS
jgi:predicted acylesterase/phospholipase RssA